MILIAIGANLPRASLHTPLETCEAALAALREIPMLHVEAVSAWYESAPIPPSGQPPYVNGVVRASGAIAPDALLQTLHDIEAAHERERSVPNAARTLDLDIIDMNGTLRDTPDPILPHPRAHLRAFVLLPLRDVAPDWVHPELQTPIETLIGRLEPQDIRRMADDIGGATSAPERDQAAMQAAQHDTSAALQHENHAEPTAEHHSGGHAPK